ncbi:MAG: 4Fe-4S dicluster domain-containing protein [Chloroflexi bacterium]|nr:4Fe-4S dicluster domain-containing protein [Chloroflexota bacterium]
MGNKISRRQLIKDGGKTLLGGIFILSVPSLLRSFTRTEEPPNPAAAAQLDQRDWETRYWGFICDTEKCIGCGRCVVACKLENKVPWEPEYNRTWVERYIFTMDGEVFVDSPNAGRDGFTAEPMNLKYQNLDVSKSFFVPKLCNQCDNPPCVTVCPVNATYRTEDGVVLIDQEHCIGCRYCIQACPYGARYVLPEASSTHFGQVRVVDKCTWCYHRISKGLLPACVEICPVGARVFGDLRDPDSPVRKMLSEKRVYVLKPTLGTEPKVYYVGFEKGVQ